jgi:hypothetical protein
MSRFYTVPFAAGTVTNAGGNADLWELLPAANKPIRLRSILFGQISEVADAAEEAVEIQIIRMTATVTGSNGSSVTPVPMDGADTAAGFTAETNGATVATTSGAATIVASFPWNLRNSPFEWVAPDERFAPGAKNAEGLFVRLISTVADDITFGGFLVVEEVA